MYSKELIVDILKYIDNNINNKISIDDISTTFNYNRFYIMKLFKRELSISIIDYINILKVYNSLSILNENYSLLTIALKCGFYSLEYYSETFKKIMGISPIIYRKIIKRKDIEDKTLDIYINRLIKIKSVISKCEKYKYNIKPSNYTKKLTIFK